MRQCLCLCVVGLLLSSPVHAQTHEPSRLELAGYWALGGLQSADISYTMFVLGRRWGQEGNPALAWTVNHPGRFAAIKWGVAGVGMWTTRRLFESGHPRWAWLSIAGQAAVSSWAVVHNHRIFQQCAQPGVICR